MYRYGACYFENHKGPKWTCNTWFKSYTEADAYSVANHTVDKLPNLQATTLISINRLWPKFIQRHILSWQFSPKVVFYNNP